VILGSIAAAVAVALAACAVRRTSTVERRLRSVLPMPAKSRSRTSQDQLALARIAGGFAGAIAGIAMAVALGIGILPVPVLVYVGVIAPSVVADRRRTRERRDIESAVITLVEWLHALVASGRPIEAAVVSVAQRGTGSAALDALLEQITRDYTLGVPLADAMARVARDASTSGLADLAARLERTRDLGRGALPMLQDLRDELRAAERARALQAASHVEGKLTFVLTLCYLPALAVLVIIPLFVTLLAGLFG
jgi:pilus assembly protein TadC